MKKVILTTIVILAACITACAQEKKDETKVQHLTYKEFLSKVWNFESNPTTFVYK